MSPSSRDTPRRSHEAQLYREAARLVERSSMDGGMYGCDAIWYAYGTPEAGARRISFLQAKTDFADYFQPDDKPYIWFGSRTEGVDDRVIALCFMAAITERP